MFDSLILAMQVVFPLCVLLVVGYVLKRWLKLADVTTKQLNQMVFKLFLPALLFKNIYTSDLSSDFDIRVVIFAICAILLMYTGLCFAIPKIESDSRKCCVMIQGIYRSNYVLYGIPVTAAIFDEHHLGMASVLAAIIIPMINILAVLLFELFRDNGKMNWGHAGKGVLKNPLVIASVLGLIFVFLRIPVPELAMESVSTLGSIATPLALIALGADFHFSSVKTYRKQLWITVTGKLVAVPVIMLTIAILLGFQGVNLVVLMVLFASPTAVASYTMACSMGGDGELAGQILVLTTLFSIVTIFAFTFLLNSMGLIFV